MLRQQLPGPYRWFSIGLIGVVGYALYRTLRADAISWPLALFGGLTEVVLLSEDMTIAARPDALGLLLMWLLGGDRVAAPSSVRCRWESRSAIVASPDFLDEGLFLSSAFRCFALLHPALP